MISAFADFGNGLLLVCKYFAPDFVQILHQNVAFHRSSNVREVVHELRPSVFPDAKAVNIGDGCVNKGSSLIECAAESTNDTLVSVLNAVPPLLVDLIPNRHFSLVDEDNV